MAGVGEGLAVLGLLIAVAENYRTISGPIRRYRNFHAELKKLQRKLATLETRYYGNAELLLRSVVGSKQARDMFEDSNHSSWENKDLEASIVKHLGKRYSACKLAVESIENTLKIIEPVNEKLAAIVEQNWKSSCTSFKEKAKEVACKLWNCSSESKLSRKLDNLKQSTDDFESLVLLNDRLLSDLSQKSCAPCLRSLSRDDVSKYSRIRRSANALYETLEESCTVHKHHAHFDLQPSFGEYNSRRVRFELAFRQDLVAIEHSENQTNEAVWLAVESSDSVEHCNTTVHGNSTETRKREHDNELTGFLTTRVQNRVRFPQTATQTALIVPSNYTALSNLCRNQSLCAQITVHWRQMKTEESCIGYLEKGPEHKHLVYLKSSYGRETQSSLNAFLSSFVSTRFQKEGLSLVNKYTFGKLMANAILHLGSTPWLMNGTWRSKDIYLLSENGSPSLDKPYINVELETSDQRLCKSDSTNQPRFIRNQPLFSLALLLLEIAYEAPFSAMCIPADLVDGPKQVEFNTAERLSNMVSSKTSPEYQRIVKRCLFCISDSTDLTDPDLQAMVYYDVFCGLERLETICKTSL